MIRLEKEFEKHRIEIEKLIKNNVKQDMIDERKKFFDDIEQLKYPMNAKVMLKDGTITKIVAKGVDKGPHYMVNHFNDIRPNVYNSACITDDDIVCEFHITCPDYLK